MKKIVTAIYALAICVSVLLFAFAPGTLASAEEQGSVYHIVICWLKDPGNESQRQQLIEAAMKLQSTPEILSIHVGHMLPSERPIVDSSYDVGIVMTFKDENSMHKYLQDPLHQKATKEILIPLTTKVVVYDFITAKE